LGPMRHLLPHINPSSESEMGHREPMTTIVEVAIRDLAAKEVLERGKGGSVTCCQQSIKLSIEES
jgi:hypothetical protein